LIKPTLYIAQTEKPIKHNDQWRILRISIRPYCRL